MWSVNPVYFFWLKVHAWRLSVNQPLQSKGGANSSTLLARGSVNWNAYRQKYVLIADQTTTSQVLSLTPTLIEVQSSSALPSAETLFFFFLNACLCFGSSTRLIG